MNINYLSCTDSMCGIARYLEELALAASLKGNIINLFRKFDGDHSFIKKYPHRSFKGLRPYIAPYYLSKAINNCDANIWHTDYVDGATALKWSGKNFSKSKIVITAHDAIPYIFQKEQSSTQFLYYKYHIKNTAKLADAIIVVSEKSKNDLVKYTDISPERVFTIYNGINHQNFYPEKNNKENEVFTIRYTGGLGKKHKNASALIETAKILEDRGINFSMEIGSGNASKTLAGKLVKRYRLKNVKFPGFIPQDKLRTFLAEADLFLYPSLYEGFGFPPLEAMACGTAVISSDRGSLKEILGNGALTMPPEPELFANAIEELVSDREKLSQIRLKGLLQASKYCWKKTSEETFKMYSEIL